MDMKKGKFLKNLKVKKKHQKVNKGKSSTQEWLPVVDVADGRIFRRDGAFASALNIEPINIDLFSDKEKARIISGVHEIVNGLKSHAQMLSIGRPVDLDGYIKGLEGKIRDTDSYIKKKLLQGYVRQAASMASGGETLERKFYFLSSGNDGSELKNRLMELSSSFATSDLNAKLCQDQELVNLEFLFTHPAHAAFERVTDSGLHLPPLYERGVANG